MVNLRNYSARSLRRIDHHLHRFPYYTRKSSELKIRRLEQEKSKPFRSFKISEEDAMDLPTLTELLSRQRGGRTKCNIIGSGMSTIAAMEEGVDSEAAYFTCNFGGFLPLKYDLYSVEIASRENKKFAELSDLQRDLIFGMGGAAGDVFLKNVWEGKISNEYIVENYAGRPIIYDALFPNLHQILRHSDYSFLFQKFFFENAEITLQISTSVLTLLQFAVRAGYRRIRIFGLDGQGPHFFHDPRVGPNSPMLQCIRKLVPPIDPKQPHKVGKPGRETALSMARYLRQYDIHVELVSAPSRTIT